MGSLVDPRLRASNEHILIMRVPRTGARPGYSSHPYEAARCASTEDQQAPASPSIGGFFSILIRNLGELHRILVAATSYRSVFHTPIASHSAGVGRECAA
jgi:hypothetical protein